MFVYLDESGDLGFKEGSSEFLIITLLKTKNEITVNRCIKKIRKRKLKKSIKDLPELKGNNTDPNLRKKLLKDLATSDIEIHCIIINKRKVYPHLKAQKFILYNYVVGKILPRALAFNRNVKVCIDRLSPNKIIRDDFDSYMQTQIEKRSIFRKPTIKLSHLDSKNCCGIQACDFISWSIFRKYNWGDDSYYNLIQHKIKDEFVMFK